MKTRIILNYLALSIPFILGLAGLITSNDDIYIYAVLSTAATGAIQVIIALTMIAKHRSMLLDIYFAITVAFFILWYFLGEELGLIAIPPILAIFLTYIIHVEFAKVAVTPEN